MTEHIKGIDAYLRETQRIIDEISREKLDHFIFELYKAWKRGSNIFFVGNGGSASTAIHFAADINNVTRGFEKKGFTHLLRFRAISLNENPSRLSALTNDEGWENVYTEQLRNFWRNGDVVVAISVNGGRIDPQYGIRSKNLLEALQFAKDNGGTALSLTGFDGGVMEGLCDVNVIVPINSTPHTEGLHVVLHHLVFTELQQRIAQSNIGERVA